MHKQKKKQGHDEYIYILFEFTVNKYLGPITVWTAPKNVSCILLHYFILSLISVFQRQITYKTGITIKVNINAERTPPTIGAASLFMTSAPMPVAHITGRSPSIFAKPAIIMGRIRDMAH